MYKSSCLMMVASLAFLGIVRALSIDNQLTVTKNDCYERLAIGQRLNPKDVYKTFSHNTVANCQKACTQEKNSCKAFSFGISVKGNATCELSIDAVKETADLKPIGTSNDNDFDLYIKKLGCSLVLDKSPHLKPSEEYQPSLKPIMLGHLKPDSSSFYGSESRPDNFYYYSPQNGYDRPQHYLPVSNEDNLHHVQTLVSVASGPQTFLHPVHDILVSESSFQSGYNKNIIVGYDDNSNRPLFRPEVLIYPPHDYDRPDPDYGSRPHGFRPPSGYGDSGLSYRPYEVVERPHLDDRYDGFIPVNGGPYKDRYDDLPPKKQFRPQPPPLPNQYGSIIPHPDDYNRPRPNNEYLFRPNDKYYVESSANHQDNPNYHFNKPERPFPPQSYGDDRDNPNYFDDKPSRPHDHGKDKINYDHDKPSRPFPLQPYGENSRPSKPFSSQTYEYNHNYDKGKPSRPLSSQTYEEDKNDRGNPSRPTSLSQTYGGERPVGVQTSKIPTKDGGYGSKPSRPDDYDQNSYNNPNPWKPVDGDKGDSSKPIVTHSIGYHGEEITSIITELKQACFRRVLAGKRVSRGFVRRAVTCETMEECQRECAEEKRFTCEGFNYRLDPTGRGKGDCELLDQPLSRLDIGRDLYPDPDYDYYERDRNAVSVSCKQIPSGGRFGGYGGGYNQFGGVAPYGGGSSYYNRRPVGSYGSGYGAPSGGGYYPDRRQDYKGERRRPEHGEGLRRPADRWPEDDRYHSRHDYGARKPSIDYDYRSGGNRRGDYSYHSHHSQQDHFSQNYNRYDDRRYSGIYYLPAQSHKPDLDGHKSYEPYLPPSDKRPYQKDRYDNHRYGGFYGSDRNKIDVDRRNYYLPPKTGGAKDWGLYGGSYGNGYRHSESYGNKQSYNYWGFDRYEEKHQNQNGLYGHKPIGSSYLPVPKPTFDDSSYKPGNAGYLPIPRPSAGGSFLPVITSEDHFENAILPAEPRRPPSYSYIKDECSLRSATGFRLHKGIVKKYFAVPNIYECELLCFREKDFPCASYAYRYTVNLAAPTDNCYLSNRNYKELDYYTDLEPDKDFDLYTMNNRNRCEAPIIQGKDNSDCFWRVRSGQRLDHKVVRDSLTTKSIVECQVECLITHRFTCRSFSYRYGSPVIGGPIDNCQLTDWPYNELDPRIHFIPETGFEIYERGSYGHGCEPNHFGIRGHHGKDKNAVSKEDQLCYIGFGTPARLLSQATKKVLKVSSELECKVACSNSREGTLFQCMSFSFRTKSPGALPNCYLSDILQRDLLPSIDYVYDPDYWLFAWDNYNPQCIALSNDPLHVGHIENGYGINDRNDIFHALDTWRVYSVSGWPCRRGNLCQENREAGFWFCYLEGGDASSWDYCCSPDHHCGASQGYPYQWCYVGPTKTQWRKCSERYFPYIHNIIDRLDQMKPHLPTSPSKPWSPPPSRPGVRPDRPPAPPVKPPIRPSLNEYEAQFEEEFLAPPKPGGFGQPRHWPVSYLHKEMPPNITDTDPKLMRMEEENPKYAAIQNLINVIKNNDLKNVQYHISNESNKEDDILFVKIPLPINFTQEARALDKNVFASNTSVNLEPVQLETTKFKSIQTRRTQKSTPFFSGSVQHYKDSNFEFREPVAPSSVYRKGFVMRTNLTTHRRQ